MPECTIATGVAGHRAKPVIENRELLGERGEHRHLLWLETLHDRLILLIFRTGATVRVVKRKTRDVVTHKSLHPRCRRYRARQVVGRLVVAVDHIEQLRVDVVVLFPRIRKRLAPRECPDPRRAPPVLPTVAVASGAVLRPAPPAP